MSQSRPRPVINPFDASSPVLHHHLAQVIQNLNVGVMIQNPKAEILWCNDAALHLLGLSMDQLLGKSSFDPDWNVIHEDGSPFPVEMHPVPQAIATRQAVRDVVMGVYRPSTRDRVWLLVSAEPDLVSDELNQVICTFSDISQRIQAQEALAAERNLLRTLIDHLPHYIFIKDTAGRFVVNNLADIRAVGLTSSNDLVGKSDFDLYSFEEASLSYAEDMRVIQSGQPVINREEIVTNEHGELIWETVSKYPLRDTYGKIIGLVGICIDISEIKRAREALQRANRDLEQRIAERMADLRAVNERLRAEIAEREHVQKERELILNRERAARREAQEAARMKDMFLATMSHELRTPLNAMIGFVHLMLYSQQLDKDNQHMAQRVLVNSKRLLSLINNILDLSRIAAGRLVIVPVTMSPRDLALVCQSDLEMQARDSGLVLESIVDDDVPETIVHDEERLTQIATNLISNAIKFTERGKVHLHIQRCDDRLIIKVSDTGVGIPKSKQNLVFDDFYQVDNSPTRERGGAGLGLSIVKKLVELMQGIVEVESEMGRGSVFTVNLPLNLPANR